MNLQSLFFNGLIISIIGVLVYIYYPVIMLYNPIPALEMPKSTYSIEVPKINAYAPIIANVDPWDKDTYQESLKSGVAQAKYYADFGETGTIFLFSHSEMYPWEVTRANTSFLKLNNLHINDQIIITKFENTYKYRVVDKKEVWPNEVKSLVNTELNQLILQTNTPLGTDLKRLLIYANEINEEPEN